MWVRHKHNTFRASLIGSLNLFFLEQINKKINSNSPFKMLKKERNCYSCSLGKESTIHAPYELNSIKYKTIQFFYSSLSLSLSLSLSNTHPFLSLSNVSLLIQLIEVTATTNGTQRHNTQHCCTTN